MPMQSEKATFVSALQQCMSLETGSALLATDVDTFEKLRAKRGLNVDTPEDGSIPHCVDCTSRCERIATLRQPIAAAEC
jgi:hypothetical protein